MIYIYNCYGGTHSSILAVAYHLKMLDETREPTKDEILELPNFNKLFHKQNVLNEKIIFSNTSPTVPLPMTFGGLFSRWLKIDFIGVPLLVKGAKQSYKNVIKLVNHTKRVAKELAIHAHTFVLPNHVEHIGS